MRSRIFVAVAACVAVVGSMMVATGTATARVGSAPTISSDEIKVGGLIETQFAGSDIGAKARIADENAKGGVNGRKITYVEGQTYPQANTAAALAEAQRLVQQEGVAAIVPALTSTPPAQFLQQQQVPTFSWNISPLGWDTPWYFGITGSLVAPFPKSAPGSASLPEMLSQQFKDEGTATGGKGKTIAIIGSDDASAKSGVNQAKKTFQTQAYKVTYAKGAFSITTPDHRLHAVRAGDHDVERRQPPRHRLPGGVVQRRPGPGQGPPPGRIPGRHREPDHLRPPDREGGRDALGVHPVGHSRKRLRPTPNVQKVVDSIHKQDPNAALSLGTLAGYFAADMFIQALKAAGKNATTAAIQKAAAKMTYQIKDVIGPTTYPAAYTLGTSCAQLAKSNGAAFQVVVKYGCYPAYVFGAGTKPKKTIPAPTG